MKTLHIYKGFEIPTDDGFRKILDKSLKAENYVVSDDGNATLTGTVLLTYTDIKTAMHDYNGQAYDVVVYDEE